MAGVRRNLRPRDESGRPLPYGSLGFPPPAVGEPVTAADAIELAQRLLEDRLPFYAHEVLEDQWKAAPEGERQLWRGLAQLAVGLTHYARGNRTGARTLIQRGSAAIEPYRSNPPHDVDVAGLLAWASRSVAQLEVGDPLPTVPQLRVGPSSRR